VSVGARWGRHVAERRLNDGHGAVVAVRVGSLRRVTGVAAGLKSQVGRRHTVPTESRLRVSGGLALDGEVRMVAGVVLVLATAVCRRGGRGRWHRGRGRTGTTVVLTLAQQHALYILPHLESDTLTVTYQVTETRN
jgi:hypothetical protein